MAGLILRTSLELDADLWGQTPGFLIGISGAVWGRLLKPFRGGNAKDQSVVSSPASLLFAQHQSSWGASVPWQKSTVNIPDAPGPAFLSLQ